MKYRISEVTKFIVFLAQFVVAYGLLRYGWVISMGYLLITWLLFGIYVCVSSCADELKKNNDFWKRRFTQYQIEREARQ